MIFPNLFVNVFVFVPVFDLHVVVVVDVRTFGLVFAHNVERCCDDRFADFFFGSGVVHELRQTREFLLFPVLAADERACDQMFQCVPWFLPIRSFLEARPAVWLAVYNQLVRFKVILLLNFENGPTVFLFKVVVLLWIIFQNKEWQIRRI